jgi:hypothetical protein
VEIHQIRQFFPRSNDHRTDAADTQNLEPLTQSGALSGLIDGASPGMLVAWQITSSSTW